MDTCEFVDLGFVVQTESWRLKSHLFPSKIGGKPAWLSLKSLPSSESLLCGNCREPCIFLLQLYSPIDGISSAFHRTIFVFICRNSDCHKDTNNKKSIIVFRSSLHRVNNFYSPDPPNYNFNDEKSSHPSAGDQNRICFVCGCLGDKKCSECHRVQYCSKKHQISHWKAGHKVLCKEERDTTATSKDLFLEIGFKMEVDDEEDSTSDDNDNKNNAIEYKSIEGTNDNDMDNKDDQNINKDNLDNKDNVINTNSSNNKESSDWKEIVERVSMDSSMKQLQRMQFNSSSHAPIVSFFQTNKPVIKYARGGTLVLNEEGHVEIIAKDESNLKETHDNKEAKYDSKIPNCENCNSERVFEFLILPHLMSILSCNDLGKSLGWVAVFTCKNNCSASKGKNESKVESISNSYLQEFACKSTIML